MTHGSASNYINAQQFVNSLKQKKGLLNDSLTSLFKLLLAKNQQKLPKAKSFFFRKTERKNGSKGQFGHCNYYVVALIKQLVGFGFCLLCKLTSLFKETFILFLTLLLNNYPSINYDDTNTIYREKFN